MTELLINFNEASDRLTLSSALKRLRGSYRITMVKHRERRSDRQNKRYWPVCVVPFAAFLREQGEQVTDLQAHELIKHRFLRKTWMDPKTGEALDYTQSSAALDLSEFNVFMQDVENWLAEFGIIVPEQTI